MQNQRKLNFKGALLDKNKLCNYLETLASDQMIKETSKPNTYPIQELRENFNFITEVYRILNQHVSLKINIHPAGEWLLDNYYIIEGKAKEIQKELNLARYRKLPGIASGYEEGFARIYVLASVIVAYTDGKIEEESLKLFLTAYQNKKALSMEEIWSLPLFLGIAIIQQIREICEKIYLAQIQKYKVESMIERLVEQKDKTQQNFNEQTKQIKRKKRKYELSIYRIFIL